MAKTETLKQENLRMIRSCFYDGKVHTRNELAEQTHLSHAGILNYLKEMMENHEILCCGEETSTGGRRSKQYQVNPDFHHLGFLLLSAGKDGCAAERDILNLHGNLISGKRTVYAEGTLEEVFHEIREAEYEDPAISIWVLSIPGICRDGYAETCDWEGLAGKDLKSELKTVSSRPFLLENDMNLAVMGLASLHPEVSDLAAVYQPSAKGTGCGIILSHHLCRGYASAAGELQYLPGFSLKDQAELLKTDPSRLLNFQIQALGAVMNPELIGWCSALEGVSVSLEDSSLPEEIRPSLESIRDLYALIRIGMRKLSIEYLLKENSEEM
ncbi:MAG: hypothetical protein MR580_06630 [Anaerolactibacter massiliensis]|nr:hypothetical protein [Anaerolactibacter massiliensis]